ncbi:hypothetical protein [Azospirillum sp. SYSU D00513]|uniref:hypothetical protein n=1 Tax=Azospirillum sp. SYSU D00513 TaxID=2812561 RepID=UPI001A95899E|nr:hypothetical protein [Azospirillum sp. SYSU D00513]
MTSAPSSAPGPVSFVTGSDAGYFAMTCLLAQSLERWMPGTRLLVCDFGLSPAQRRFLTEAGRLVPRPASVPEGAHPYLAKAALADYLNGIGGPILWLDCDMMIAGSLEAPLAALLEAMERADAVFAAASDAEVGDIASFIALWGVPPFDAAVRAAGIDPGKPYLNSGLFLCQSAEALAGVRDRCAALEDHRMIDQNAFNLAAWEPGRRCAVLKGAVWNVHGRLLAQTRAREDGTVLCGEHRALVLHATSIGGVHHEERQGSLRGPAGDFPVRVKFFREPALAAMQQGFLGGFVAAHRPALAAAGLMNGQGTG